MKSQRSIKGDIVIEYLKNFPKAGNLTLAKKIFEENVGVYEDVEDVRSKIRYYVGQKGTRSRRYNKELHKPAGDSNAFHLPESEAIPWAPVTIPSIYNNGLIFNDSHVPYHDVRAFNTVLEYTLQHRKINFIIINGDGMDCYQGSKFNKDPRNPSISDEIWIFIEFLHILQSAFPGVKIFWKLGNHEERLENYLRTQAPAVLDMQEFKLGNIIKIRGVEGVDVIEKQIIYAGRVPIVHGHEFMNKTSSPVNAARGLFLKTLSSAIVGHHHQTSFHPSKDINGKLMSSFSIGCLCDLHPEYALLNNWNHGFAHIDLEGKEFEVDNLKIHKGKVYR